MSKIKQIKESVLGAKIVAATKYVGPSEMLKLLEHNICDFGENRVDSFLEKYEVLKDNQNITWHFIGTLQTNKVKKMINCIDYLHSLNSYRLASVIDKYREKPLKCFLEINLTNSSTKTGIFLNEVESTLKEITKLKNIEVIGLMAMTETYMTDLEKEEVFNKLSLLKTVLNNKGYESIKELSMGMSDDYHIAVKCGATFVRLGRILFS